MEEILNFLDLKDLIKTPSCYSMTPLKLPFELKPEDYIKFAEEDLNEETTKNFINAISNIKRAIDCRTESLIYLFGAYDLAKRDGWTFPTKMKFLEEAGIIASRILNKINKKRNLVEHDFKKPLKEEVEDFFDVTNLFLLYTQSFVSRTYDDYFEWELEEKDSKEEIYNSDWIRIKLDSKNSCFKIELIKNGKERKECIININDKENYLRVLKQWSSCIIQS